MVVPIQKKYGAINCEDAEKWGTSEELGNMLINRFKRDNQHWEYFSACSGDVPDMKRIDEYKGFVVSGSHYSANDKHEWIRKLEKFFRELYDYQQKVNDAPKLVGICFGHQLIGKALGAKVIKNNGGRFIFKQVNIRPTEVLREKNYYKNVFDDDKILTLFQSHGEEIIELPSSAKCVASSNGCENEIALYGESVLTIQGHMEITEEQMLGKILPAIKKAGIFSEDEEKEMLGSLEVKVSDRRKVVALIQSFLKE